MKKYSPNRTYIDNLMPFRITLIDKMMIKKFISAKRSGSVLKVTLWNRAFFHGAHKKRIKYDKSRDGEKDESSLRRAQQNVFDLVEINLEEWKEKAVFLTLTYQKELVTLNEANKDFTDFIRRVKYRTGINPQYVCVPEFQKRGTPHFHIVFFNMPFMYVSEEVKNKYKKNKSRFEITWNQLWGYGDVNVKLIRNNYTTKTGKKISSGCASYMTKYLSKQFQDERLYGNKTYFSSRGLYRPQKFYSELVHETYDSVMSTLYNIFGLDDSVETTYIKLDSADSEFFTIIGKDKKGPGNLTKRLSGKSLKIKGD